MNALLTLSQLEFVKNKSTKEPFPVADHISEEIAQLGTKQAPSYRHERFSVLTGAALDKYDIQFYPCGGSNGKDGQYLMLAPAYNIDEKDVELIVGKLKEAITEYFSTRKNLEVESS